MELNLKYIWPKTVAKFFKCGIMLHMKDIKIFYSKDWVDYELLDTGEGEKLERVGKYNFVRPYEDAVWKKTFSKKEWENVDGKFWSSQKGAKAGWKMYSKDGPWGNSLKDRPF